MEGTLLVGMPKDADRELIKERKSLADLLRKEDFPVQEVDVYWPRNCFVSHNDKIYWEFEHGSYADGGFIITAPEFVIASSYVNFHSQENYNERLNRLKRMYNKSKILVIPDPHQSNGEETSTFESPHIDLVVLPIPLRKLLIIDSSYYKIHTRDVENLSQALEYKILIVKTGNPPNWPCNALVIEHDNKLIAYTNSDSDLKNMLKPYDIEVKGVSLKKNCEEGGSVRCITNVFPEGYKSLHLLTDERTRIPRDLYDEFNTF